MYTKCCLKAELVEEILDTSSLLITLGGGLVLVLLFEDLLDVLAGFDAVGFSKGVLIDGLLQVDIDRVSAQVNKDDLQV